MAKSRRRYIWILLAAMILLVVVAVSAVVAYLLLRQPQKAAAVGQDPLAAIVPGEVSPDLALYPLAGASDLEAIDAATETGELMTALATLGFSSDVSDRQRIGRLTVLGGRFAESKRPEMASLAFQAIYDLALLSPRLNDPLRADALRAAAEGWAGLGEKTRAVQAYDAMRAVGTHSPYLQTAQRIELLVVVAEGYRALNQDKLAQESTAQIREMSEEPMAKVTPVQVQSPELPFGQTPVSSAEVGVLEDSRRQAAYALISGLADEQQPAPELVSKLAEALKAEDAAKLALYAQELTNTSQPSQRIEVHWQMIRWLLLKYQIAAKDMGLSVLPDWEAQLPEVQSALSKAYEDLLFDYEDLATALPNASLIGPGRYVARRLTTLAGRLGQYPNFPAEQMAEKLKAAVTDLISSGQANGLYVDVLNENGNLRFLFRPATEYGQPTPAP